MNNNYRIAILYFCLFSLLLLGSSVALFSTKIGLSADAVSTYYQGSDALLIPAKSFEGLLEIITPHTFSMALFVMVLTHFILFIKKDKTPNTITLIIVLYTALFIEIFSPLGIIYHLPFFNLLKWGSYFILEAISLYFIAIVYLSAYKSLNSTK